MNYFSQKEIRNYAEFLYGLSGNELASLAFIVGLLLSQNINSKQINSLGNFFEAVGQTMLVIGSQEQLLDNNKSNYNSK